MDTDGRGNAAYVVISTFEILSQECPFATCYNVHDDILLNRMRAGQTAKTVQDHRRRSAGLQYSGSGADPQTTVKKHTTYITCTLYYITMCPLCEF